ncbi:MAG: ABC transporter ATP-binding protein [Candidatus Kapabacteria bacterium]|nr:ABC transporter ATP-binding protein [Candidatus Kapabacteria bacterium]
MSLLHLQNVVKRLGSDKPTGKESSETERSFSLRIPTFTLSKGSEMVIVGESGSGKTTLLHLIAGIITPDEGSIMLNGTDIATLPEAKRDRFRAAHVGCVYQTFNLLQGLTARENVLAATMFSGKKDNAEERSMMLLARLGLKEKMHRRPRELSIGEQQRVAVARALVNAPALVLADEPTASVDARNARTVIDTMRELAHDEGTSILVITHDAAVQAMFPTSVAIGDIVQR